MLLVGGGGILDFLGKLTKVIVEGQVLGVSVGHVPGVMTRVDEKAVRRLSRWSGVSVFGSAVNAEVEDDRGEGLISRVAVRGGVFPH